MSDVSEKPQKQSVWLQVVEAILLLFFVAGILIYSNWDEFSDFLRSLLWPLIITGISFLILCFLLVRFLMRRNGRFKRWHIIKRSAAYFADPQKLSNTVQNIDHFDELDIKVENRSLTNMASELKEAEQDYSQAIKRCNGSKAAEKAVKEAYAQRCSRIREKYNA